MVKLGDVAVRFGVWSNICMIQFTNSKKKEESKCTKPFSTLSEPAGASKEVWSDTNHTYAHVGVGIASIALERSILVLRSGSCTL